MKNENIIALKKDQILLEESIEDLSKKFAENNRLKLYSLRLLPFIILLFAIIVNLNNDALKFVVVVLVLFPTFCICIIAAYRGYTKSIKYKGQLDEVKNKNRAVKFALIELEAQIG